MTNEHRLGDQQIEARFRKQMQALAEDLDKSLNGGKKGKERSVGFVLMIFPFDEHGGRCNYISNGADRRDVVKLMREQIARFEGRVTEEHKA